MINNLFIFGHKRSRFMLRVNYRFLSSTNNFVN